MTLGTTDSLSPEVNSPLLPDCELIGESDQHLIKLSDKRSVVHPEIVDALQALQQKAKEAGFNMRVASGFRSFDRQLLIWNNKAHGLRPVLDEEGRPVDMAQLSDDEKVFAILRWSALPGASRHHWGTDIDVYDTSRMPDHYELQLTTEETEGDGVCAEFHLWLTKELQENSAGFYRPYVKGVGSISPEPWHLSYAPLARRFATQLTETVMREKLQATDIALKDSVLRHLSTIYQNYIKPYQV